MKKRYNINDVQKVAHSKNGVCLSEEYVNNQTNMYFKCNVCEHKWSARFGNILNGNWCPSCSAKARASLKKKSITDMHILANSHEGKCLSEVYVDCKTKLHWECKYGHRFWAIPSNVKTGFWCPDCGRKRTGEKRRRYTEKDLKQFESERHIEIVKLSYDKKHAIVLTRCTKCQHIWEANPLSIIKKSIPCPKCNMKEMGKNARKYSIEYCHTVASDHQGYFLSEIYFKANDKYTWKCQYVEHPEFEKSLTAILGGQWCPKCRYIKVSKALKGRSTNSERFYDINYCKNWAIKKNGQCLSPEYIDSKTPLLWKCNICHHEWLASPGSIFRAETWCPRCAGKIKTKEDMHIYANSWDGEFLSDNYLPPPLKMKWKCNNGHIFEAAWDVLYNGCWCNECSSSIGERITRGLMNRIFNTNFLKTRFDTLINDEGNILEVDGYAKELNIAFEYQGSQHYKYVKHFHRTQMNFEKRIRDDSIKLDWCKSQNITLIVIPQYQVLSNIDYIIKTVELLLKEANIQVPIYQKPKTHGEVLVSDIRDLKDIVNGFSGELLSDAFLGWGEKHRFKCQCGHVWDTTAYSIKNGSWCQKCAGKKRGLSQRQYNIDYAKKIAIEKNGICVSNELTLASIDLTWQCNICNTIWNAPLTRIHNGGWCPNCGKIKSALNRRKYSIDDLNNFASKRNGQCLSKDYIGYASKYLWKCKNNHEWEASFSDVKNGTWCSECSQKKKKTIEHMIELAKRHNGECLSTEYLGAFKHLQWKCEHGHVFPAMPTNVQQGKWCPDCKGKRIWKTRKRNLTTGSS